MQPGGGGGVGWPGGSNMMGMGGPPGSMPTIGMPGPMGMPPGGMCMPPPPPGQNMGMPPTGMMPSQSPPQLHGLQPMQASNCQCAPGPWGPRPSTGPQQWQPNQPQSMMVQPSMVGMNYNFTGPPQQMPGVCQPSCTSNNAYYMQQQQQPQHQQQQQVQQQQQIQQGQLQMQQNGMNSNGMNAACNQQSMYMSSSGKKLGRKK